MTKVISGVVGLATAVMMVAPGVASALTAAEIQAQIAALQAQLSSVGGSTSSAACSYVFTKTLKQGTTDAEVMSLQKVLNMNAATAVASSGVGSAGMETSYFGGMTKAAVVKFQEMYASDILTPNGLTKGTGLVGAATRAKLNTMCSSTGNTTTGNTTTGNTTTTGTASVTASLDATSPVNGTVISPSGVTTLAVFKLTNMGSAPAKVTKMVVQRTGVSSDSTLNNVYLYNGATRLTDAASVSQSKISFTDSAGIVTVPAMSSVSVAVRADVASSMAGQTIGMMLTEVTADAGVAAGTPVSGAQFLISAQPSGMATADFTGSFTPASGSIDPQNDYVVWQKNIQIGNRDAMMSSIRFQQIGSVYTDDVKNFRLMIDGVQVGGAVEKADANRFVTFAFPAPVVLKSGNHTVKMVADIVAGSGRNFNFSLRRVVDVEIWDSQLNVVVSPTVGGSTFTTTGMQSTSAINVNAGTVTVTKATDSPSGNVVKNGSAVTLGKWKMKAQGEELKVENLTFSLASSTYTLRSGAVYADGVQIGSTQDLTGTGKTYNLGSSLVLTPGKEVTVELRADVYNNATGGNTNSGDTITVRMDAGSANAYQRTSLGYINAPSAQVAANQVTVASGSLTLAKATAFANQTVVVPRSAQLLGEFNLTTGSTEGVNVDTFSFGNGGNAGDSNVTDVYVVYGSKTTVTKATIATSTFSVNEAVAANTTLNVKVYGNINSSVVAGKTVIVSLTVSGTSQSSGQAVTSSAVTGQTITAGTGSLTVATDSSTPVAALVVGNSMPKIASFKFTASNDSYTIVDVTATTSDASSIVELVFKDGATEIGRQPFNGTVATKTGLAVAVAANSNKVIDVYANLGTVGTNAGTSGANIKLALSAVKYRDSNGVETTTYYSGSREGNSIYVYKTKPTVALVALPTSVLSAGTQTIAKFSVTADAGGSVNWDKVVFTVTTAGGVNATGSPALYDADDQTTALGTCTASGSSLSCTGINKSVTGTKTYVVKATVAGNITTGASVSTSIAQGATAYAAPTTAAAVEATSASFVWSDESVIGHSLSTSDWNNDYLVKNIPTDSQTMTK